MSKPEHASAELVVQNTQAYQELLDRMDEMETLLALDEAAGEIERGDVVPAGEMMARLRKEFRIPRRRR